MPVEKNICGTPYGMVLCMIVVLRMQKPATVFLGQFMYNMSRPMPFPTRCCERNVYNPAGLTGPGVARIERNSAYFSST